jgi:predicted membrane protein
MERCDENFDYKPNKTKKVVFGLIVVLLGALLLADNFQGLGFHIRSVVFSFPMLIIAVGVLNLFSRKSFVTGVVIVMIGAFFLIPKIFCWVDADFTRLFWPTILIAIGILIIVRRGFGPNRSHIHAHIHKHFHEATKTEAPEGYIDEVNIFGGAKKRINMQNFRGGKITSLFGGSELDFTGTRLAEGTNIIDMVCIFGGTSLIVPSDWNVRSEVVSVLGGFADKRISLSPPASNDRELIIKGVAIFGGGDIRNN